MLPLKNKDFVLMSTIRSENIYNHAFFVFLKFDFIFLSCLNWLSGTAAVSGSANNHLDGDVSRFQRLSSIDAFNQVSIAFKKKIFFNPST